MKFKTADISGILEIMSRLYLEILEIEQQYGLLFGNGDFRPRIEYFHDAIRALTRDDPRDHAPRGRLTVEMLGYDVSCLRYIQAMPLATFNDNSRPVSPIQGAGSMVPLGHPVKPDHTVKIRLCELYQQYGVLFVSLFKPQADTNFHSRTDVLNDEVKQLSEILHAVNSGASERELRDAIAHLDNPELKKLVYSLLESKTRKDLIPVIRDAVKNADNTIATLDKAHMQYASAQLGLFEDGKDIIKKLAAKGMNLAGRFVEEAMAASRSEKGRGGR